MDELKHNNTAKDIMDEEAVIKTGKELFGSLQGPQTRLFSKKWWYGNLLQRTLTHPSFKTPLFRFVDVFPSLNKKEDVLSILTEYMGGSKNSPLPPFLKKGIAFLPPTLLSAFISKQMKEMARLFIIGEDLPSTIPTLNQMRKDNCAFTLDLLGEATLSEQEAHTYQNRYLQIINQLSSHAKTWQHNPLTDENEKGEPIPLVNISVKISSLDSQIFTVSWENSKQRLKNKLRPLFKTAIQTNTFINIDMEQYEYKTLTLQIFKELVTEPEFKNYPHFGIVIQAYLRDSLNDLRDLALFVQQRPRHLTVRLVKGAYWDYELIHSKQLNWPCPVYLNKHESDTNFTACANLILQSHPRLRLALGTHNIRALTQAIHLTRAHGRPQKALEVQTLYGMAPAINSALIKQGFRVRQYCPLGTPIPGMAYLVRRLLENTANESFIRSWEIQKHSIEDLLKVPTPTTDPNEEMPAFTGRTAGAGMTAGANKAGTAGMTTGKTDKTNMTNTMNMINKIDMTTKTNITNTAEPEDAQDPARQFQNTPTLDFSIVSHRDHFQKSLNEWQKKLPLDIPLVINNQTITTKKTFNRENPSDPSQIVAQVSQADKSHCTTAVQEAVKQFTPYSNIPARNRYNLLMSLAQKMEDRRYALSALQVLEVGKTRASADADVCEAIDFCRYYASEMLKLTTPSLTDQVLGEESFYTWRPRGPAIVIAPWNFPLAILTGMTTACLATGNTVLIKPAEQSSAVAYELMKLLIECGWPAGTAQFLPGRGEETGALLVGQKETQIVAFTGSKEVGCAILEKSNQVTKGNNKLKKCIVEMGGKNAIIIDDSADLDIAVAGVVESAFEFQGQKCSACSRVLVARSIEKQFTERLLHAIESLTIGPAQNPETRIGPVVDTPALKKIHSYIKEGKKTARLISKNQPTPKQGHFVSPAIFSHVPPNSPLLKEEIFGPVICLIPFTNLEEAVRTANDTPFALTGGFYSRSPDRIQQVKKSFQVGNLYINRNCTGALVKRHPFGGFKMSGLGHKAGGPDYLKQFMNPQVVTENTVRRGFSPHLFNNEVNQTPHE